MQRHSKRVNVHWHGKYMSLDAIKTYRQCFPATVQKNKCEEINPCRSFWKHARTKYAKRYHGSHGYNHITTRLQMR